MEQGDLVVVKREIDGKIENLLGGKESFGGRRLQGFDLPINMVLEWEDRPAIAGEISPLTLNQPPRLIINRFEDAVSLPSGWLQLHLHHSREPQRVMYVYHLAVPHLGNPQLTRYINRPAFTTGREEPPPMIPTNMIKEAASLSTLVAFNRFLDAAAV